MPSSSNSTALTKRHQPKHPTHNPPYQINYRSKRCGKHITATKRRITFQFGFSNPTALQQSKTGTDCRGEEHTVVLIWSHMSGKRSLFMDGKEVHLSKAANVNTRFEYSWNTRGGHVLKFVGNAAPPTAEMRRINPELRQFDLFLDGRSFFNFLHIYQLGNDDAATDTTVGSGKENYAVEDDSYAPTPRQIDYSHSYYGQEEEIVDNDEELEMVPPPISEVAVAPIDLFDLPSESYDIIDTELPSSSSSPSNSNHYYGSNVENSYSNYYDEFSPREVCDVNNDRTFYSISNEIMCAYNSGSNSNTSTNTIPQAANQPNNVPQDYAGANSNSLALVLTSNPTNNTNSYSTELVIANETSSSIDALTKSMQNLVNLDDITSKPFQTLSNSNNKNNTKKMPMNKPANMSWNIAGRAPTLAEIHDSIGHGSSSPVKKEVMKTHHYPMQQQQQQYQQPQYQQGYQQQQQFQQPHQQQGFNYYAEPSYYAAAY